jgi:cell division protein FtsB
MSYNRHLTLAVKAKDHVLSRRDDGLQGEPGLRRKAFVLGTVIALIALAVGSVFGDRGLLRLVEKRRQVESLRFEIEDLRAENTALVGEIAALRQSPRAIERLAREELGLARPDETVFLIREEDPGPRP